LSSKSVDSAKQHRLYQTPEPIRESDVDRGLPGIDARRVLQEDGVVCLRGAHDSARFSLVEEGIEQALSGASEDVDIVEKSGDIGRFSFSSQAWQQVEAFRRAIKVLRHSDARHMAALIGRSLHAFIDDDLFLYFGVLDPHLPPALLIRREQVIDSDPYANR
jgi:hypothetical protein|tara:strand:+ start:713 stop:1198 length:486 start_codon:yes stop_codon:yes gene_type:complete